MKAVIFDLDGVVVDTAKYHFMAWKKLASELGFEFDIVHNEKLKGVSRMDSLNIVLNVGNITGLSDSEKLELADRKNNYYLDMISNIDSSEILPYIPQFLNQLKDKGYKIALGSASKSGKRILNQLKLSDKFDIIVDGNLVQTPKPNPEIFMKAAELLNVPCDKCIVVEDSQAGIEAAVCGHMKSIGIGKQEILNHANIVVDSTDKLKYIDVDAVLNQA